MCRKCKISDKIFLMNLLKKITTPIFDQLKQGVTPKKMAQSIAFGAVLGTMPILGVTTSLCVLAAFIFKLNHVAIQTVNYVAYPIQIALIIPYIRMGEWIFKQPPAALNIITIAKEFQEHFGQAFSKYIFLGLMGFSAWLIFAPIVFTIIYTTFNYLFNLKMKSKN